MADIKLHPSYRYAAAVRDGKIDAPKYVRLQATAFCVAAEGKHPFRIINEQTVGRIDGLLKLFQMPKGMAAGSSVYECSVGYQWLFYIATLCTVRRDDPGKRVYETALLEIARKNFKTYTVAVLFLLLCFLEPRFSKMFSVAPDGTLSREVKSAIEEIIKASPALRPEAEPERYFKIRLNSITFKPSDISYIPLNYSNSRMDGRLPSAFLVDEAGALPNAYAIEAMQSGQVGIKNKLGIIISTKYPNTNNPFEDQIDYAKKVLEGTVEDNTLFALLYEPDDIKSWMENDCVLRHANPSALEIPELWEDLLKKRSKAIEMPAARENFLCKHCNITYQGLGTESYISVDAVRACAEDQKINWDGMQVYVGVDLAITTDNCSVAMVGLDDNEKVCAEVMVFFPEDRMEEKSKTEGVDYRLFVEQMQAIACGGPVVDYAVVEDFVFQLEEKFGVTVVGIGYDRMNAMSSAQRWERGRDGEEGYNTVIVRQHSDTLHPTVKLLEELILAGRFRYERNKLLEINFENARCTYDTNRNRYVNKKRSKGKVDMVFALLDALYLLQQNEYLSDGDGFVSQSI